MLSNIIIDFYKSLIFFNSHYGSKSVSLTKKRGIYPLNSSNILGSKNNCAIINPTHTLKSFIKTLYILQAFSKRFNSLEKTKIRKSASGASLRGQERTASSPCESREEKLVSKKYLDNDKLPSVPPKGGTGDEALPSFSREEIIICKKDRRNQILQEKEFKTLFLSSLFLNSPLSKNFIRAEKTISYKSPTLYSSVLKKKNVISIYKTKLKFFRASLLPYPAKQGWDGQRREILNPILIEDWLEKGNVSTGLSLNNLLLNQKNCVTSLRAEQLLSEEVGYNPYTSPPFGGDVNPFYVGSPSGVNEFQQKNIILNYKSYQSKKDLFRNKKIGKTCKAENSNLNVLVVSTNPDFSNLIGNFFQSTSFKSCSLAYCNEKWVGGLLTNWKQVSKSIQVFGKFSKKFGSFVNQNNIYFPRFKKLHRDFQGFSFKTSLKKDYILPFKSKPDLIILINSSDNKDLIQEANNLNIPIIGIVNSNTKPLGITYPVPGNSNSAHFVYFFLKWITKILKNANLV